MSVRAWRESYRSFLPGEFLGGLCVPERTRAWDGYLEALPADDRLWVVERAGEVLGFCRTGPAGEPGAGEVHGLYVDPRAHGQGLGRLVFEHAVADLRGRGYRPVVLWVFAANERAQRFYRAAGFEPDGREREWVADGGGAATVERSFRG